MKQMLIAGNWKMNTNAFESAKLAEYIAGGLAGKKLSSSVLVCPPFTSLQAVQQLIENSTIHLGAQNCHYKEKGAYTGEISLPMLAHLGCTYVIIGHSERRTYFHEDDQLVNLKTLAALESNFIPVVCIGETLEERKNNKTFEVLERQIAEGLKNIPEEYENNIVIAYEPVWAIGTGINAAPGQIAEAHDFIKKTATEVFGTDLNTPVLYGGSVNGENAKEILELENVNGALIGGASLKADVFLSIINTAEEILNRG